MYTLLKKIITTCGILREARSFIVFTDRLRLYIALVRNLEYEKHN